ncbi:MAG: ABC transporter permease [Chloroflexota bacterium]
MELSQRGDTAAASGAGELTARFVKAALSEPLVLKTLALVLLLALWQVVGSHLNPLFLSTPVDVARSFVALLLSNKLLPAVGQTLRIFMEGLVLVTLVGIPVGLFMGHYPGIREFLETYVSLLYALPFVAILPLFIIWFGLGDMSKLAIVLYAGLFPMIINTETGVRSVDASYIEVIRSFGASEGDVMWHLILPASVPYIAAGLRIVVGRCLVAVILGEMFTAISGLGDLITRFGNLYETANMFVPVLILGVLGLLLTQLVRAVESRLSRWRVGSQVGTAT